MSGEERKEWDGEGCESFDRLYVRLSSFQKTHQRDKTIKRERDRARNDRRRTCKKKKKKKTYINRLKKLGELSSLR